MYKANKNEGNCDVKFLSSEIVIILDEFQKMPQNQKFMVLVAFSTSNGHHTFHYTGVESLELWYTIIIGALHETLLHCSDLLSGIICIGHH